MKVVRGRHFFHRFLIFLPDAFIPIGIFGIYPRNRKSCDRVLGLAAQRLRLGRAAAIAIDWKPFFFERRGYGAIMAYVASLGVKYLAHLVNQAKPTPATLRSEIWVANE